MFRPLRTFFSLLCLSLIATSVFATGDIRFTSTVEIEVQQKNASGETVLVRQPADTVEPGATVIYTNSFTNTGQMPADNIVINSPVPANTEYLADSATTTGYDVTYSVDQGKQFGKPETLTLPDGKGGQRPAEPTEYTNIRWKQQTPLKPQATGIVEFRVRVK